LAEARALQEAQERGEQERRMREAERLQEEARKAAEAKALELKRFQEEQERQARLRQQQEAERAAKQLAEQRAKEEQEAALRAKEEAKRRQDAQMIKPALEQNVCTLRATGSSFVYQPWYECVTCGLLDGSGCCEVCKDVCKGHVLKSGGNSPFFCDCGSGNCAAFAEKKAPAVVQQEESAEGKHVKILQECLRTGKQWTDPEFPPTATSLIRKSTPRVRADWANLKWNRPEQLVEAKQPRLFVDPLDADDIRQGALGDCWFLSALSVLALRGDRVLESFVIKEYNKAGVFCVRFFKNGKVVDVLVDSYIPVSKNGGPAMFARSVSADELWVIILEKAYAKLHGSYEAIESGFVDQALMDLTGGVGSRIDMTNDEVKQQIRNGTLWSQLLTFHASGYLMGAGSPAGSDSESNASSLGIVQGHAYGILDVKQADTCRLIQLRNPWGRKEWTGDFSDKSAKWTRRLKALVNYKDADDGAFWMEFADFTKHFEDIYVCRFFEAPTWRSLEIPGRWRKADKTAGGCTNFASVQTSPQFLVTVNQKTNINFLLQQEDNRGTDKPLFAIAIELYSNKGRRITRRITGEMVASNSESYIYRREVSLETSLSPSPQPYTMLISTFNADEEADWTLRIFSDKEITVTPAPAVA